MRVRGVPVDLVEERVVLGERELLLLRPRDSETLLDEEAFEHEEFLPYWAELWPSALALAREVCGRSLGDARVLELGCGLGLPSIAAALAGADVLATDWSADAVAFARENARRNDVAIETAVCAWSDADDLVAAGPWDVVLASDVLYERRNVELLLAVLRRLVDARGVVLLADPGRPHAPAFLDAAGSDWHVATSTDSALPRVALHELRKRP